MSKLLRLKERLNDYYAAESAILSSQEYQQGNFRLRRADLLRVQKMIKELEGEIAFIENGGRRAFRVIPVD